MPLRCVVLGFPLPEHVAYLLYDIFLYFRYKWRGLLASTGSLLMCSTIAIAAIYGVYDLDPIINLRLPFGEYNEM